MNFSITNILAKLLIKVYTVQANKQSALIGKLEAMRVASWERAAQLEIEAGEERTASKGFYHEQCLALVERTKLVSKVQRVKEFFL